MFRALLFMSIGCASTLVGLSDALARDELRYLKFQPEIKVNFDGSDSQATSTARKMYGKKFRLVDAKRVWLKEPDDGYEQMVVRLSTERTCTDNCTYAVLFYDDKQWLELWRGTAKEFELGPLGDNGMRGIYDGSRMWQWTGDEYWPGLAEYKFLYRDAKPEEKRAVDAALSAGTGEKRDDTTYSVLDLPLKNGTGAIVSIQSPYYCGQLNCPAFVLNEKSELVGNYDAIESQAGASPLRDKDANPLIETVTSKGLTVYQLGGLKPDFTIDAQTPIIAGRDRK